MTATDWLLLAPFFLTGLVVTAADFVFYTSREPLSLGYSAVERVLIAARALWFYADKLLWPANLAVIYPLWEVRAGDALGWAYVVAAAGLAALLWLARHRFGRGPAAGTAFFAVTLSPMLETARTSIEKLRRSLRERRRGQYGLHRNVARPSACHTQRMRTCHHRRGVWRRSRTRGADHASHCRSRRGEPGVPHRGFPGSPRAAGDDGQLPGRH